DIPRLVAMELQVPDISSAGPDAVVRLAIPEAWVTPRSVQQLKEILRAHPGPAEVRLLVRGRTRTTVYRLGFRVGVGPGFWADLKAAVAVTQAPPPGDTGSSGGTGGISGRG
ncbi:hypothetical protein ACWF94_25730, partial [Streptomyces sp. NPDC055078]